MNCSNAARIIIRDFLKYNRENRDNRAKLKKFLKEQRISTSKAVKMLRNSINRENIRKQRKIQRSFFKKDIPLKASHAHGSKSQKQSDTVPLDAFTQYLIEEFSSGSDDTSSDESDDEESAASLSNHDQKNSKARKGTTKNACSSSADEHHTTANTVQEVRFQV